MACTSKSPIRVLYVAYRVAQRSLPAYSHRCSPKKYTQHQLFACLVLKEFFKLDYRGVEALLAESDSMRAAIDLRQAPDFTTLHKACSRLLRMQACNKLLDETVRVARRLQVVRSPVTLSAIDSSGFEAHRISNYFVRRRASHGKDVGKWQSITYRRFPKMGVVCDCNSHLILAAKPHRGPSPDFDHWFDATAQARRRVRMTTLLADAGYDAEWIHMAAREEFGCRAIIPPRHGRPSASGIPNGYFRRRMARHFDRAIGGAIVVDENHRVGQDRAKIRHDVGNGSLFVEAGNHDGNLRFRRYHGLLGNG